MARKNPGSWWWLSFFAVGLSQHLMLVGITLPLYTIYTSTAAWHPLWDTLAAAGCTAGEW